MEFTSFTEEQKKLCKEYKSSVHGLSSSEMQERIAQYGQNRLVEKKRKQFFITLLSKFANPLVLILLVASFISAFAGELVNFIIIFSIICISIVIETYQEHQSDKAAQKLKAKVAVKILALRDGKEKEIRPTQLTIGDVVLLNLGDIIPADLKIVSAKDLHADESSLTGESFPVQKNEGDEILMGSTVMNGEGIGIVTRLAKETQFGKIAQNLDLKRPDSDFEKGIRKFGYLVMRVTFILVIFIFFVNIVFHHNPFESFLFALALAVGITPELLPMIVMANLAKGATRMSEKGVIVKHLPSIQNFGSMNILCSDKTGTLTENKIILERYENIFAKDDKKVLEYAYVNSVFQSNAKNPMDEAVLAHKEAKNHEYKKIDEIPFDFIRKRLSVVVSYEKTDLLICKGAPEGVLNQSHFYDDGSKKHEMTEDKKQQFIKRYEELSSEGFRVLAISYKHMSEQKKIFDKKDEEQLIFLGFIAFLDPPKKEVKEIIGDLAKSGIELKILTGDSELVTKKVCEELGIPVTGIVLGKDLVHVTDEALVPVVLKANIFARLTPDEKTRVITALKKANYVVGYLGDGVNDAPSLRAADIGISVNNAVDVAKEAADIILLKKSLRVLKDGVNEGRKTFSNTMKYIFMGMGSNFGNMFSVSAASIFLPFLPLLPVQILLNNLIYDISQLSLSTDIVDPEDTLQPKRWNMQFIKKFMFIFGPISSAFDFLTFFVLLSIFHATIPMFRTGWFVESLVTQSLIILVIRTRRIPFFHSIPSKLVLTTSIVAVIIGILITQTPLGSYFEFVPLPFLYWTYLLCVVICYFAVVDLAKDFFYTRVQVKK